MRTHGETTKETRQGIRIFTVLTGMTAAGTLAWHFVKMFVGGGDLGVVATNQDYVLAAALFGVFLGGIYPGFLGRQSLGGTVAMWVCASLPLGTMLGLSVAYIIWLLG